MQPFKYNPSYNSGSFRNKITFQSFNPDANDEDGFPLPPDEQWMDYKVAWAMIKTIKGNEYYAAASVQAENTTRFVIRYTTGIDNTMRIKYIDKNSVVHFYEIIAPPINDDEKYITLTIITKEVI